MTIAFIGGEAGFLSVLILAIGSLAGAWIFIHRRYRRFDGVLRGVAERMHVVAPLTDDWGVRAMGFTIEQRPALLEFESGERPSTRVKVSLPRHSPGALRVVPREFAGAQTGWRVSPDQSIGDRAFDFQYYVGSRPPSLARRIFSEERRDEVLRSVRRLPRSACPSIEITRDSVVVRVGVWLNTQEQILDLIETTREFVVYLLRLGPEDGIAWMAGDGAEPGTCPVCADPLKELVVRCELCSTPQHRECWSYVGRCATYACRGRNCVA